MLNCGKQNSILDGRRQLVEQSSCAAGKMDLKNNIANGVFILQPSDTEGNKQENLSCPGTSDDKQSSNIFMSSGIYIHPLTFNGNYEGVIELIDVDPNEKLSSPPHEDGSAGNDSNLKMFDSSPFNFSLESHVGCGVTPFFRSLANIPVTEASSLQLVYNNMGNGLKPAPSYLDINSFLTRDLSAELNGQQGAGDVERSESKSEDDDVIFVKEWISPKREPEEENPETPEDATSPSTSAPVVKRRRRRRTFGEKRKNPIRKAQINKASMDLAEKLAIPQCIFNARIKGRKPKEKAATETKSTRQSCRTSGAILSPPRILTKCDFREWPSEGMHERPFYNEIADAIIKYHIPENNGEALSRPAALRTASEEQSGVNPKLAIKRRITSAVQPRNDFAKLMLDRMEIMFDYVSELKEFNGLICEKDKSTLLDEDEAGPSSEVQPNGVNTDFNSRQEVQENVQESAQILQDTCMLYSLASGASSEDLLDLVSSFSMTSRKYDKE